MNSYPSCMQHQYSPMQFIEVLSEKCNWMCSSCLFNDMQRIQKSTILDLFQLKQNPFKLQSIFPEFFNIFKEQYKMLDDLQKNSQNLLNLLSQTIKILQTMATEIQSQMEKSQAAIQTLNKKEEEILNIKQFSELSNALWNFQTNLSQDTKQQFELQFHSYIHSLKQPSKMNYDFQNEIKNIQNIFENKKFFDSLNELDCLFQKIKQESNFAQNLILFFDQASIKNEPANWALKQVQLKENKYVKVAKMIYEGKKEQPYNEGLVQAIVGKKNLLMVFQSKNKGGTFFGAYTPYEWKYDCKHYGNKINNTSFIFSYSLKSVYPIKLENAEWTQELDTGGYFLFGGTWKGDSDMLIYLNFNIQGYSQLGKSYDAPGVDSTKRTDVLFGGLSPNIEECQIYELSFW